LKSRSNQSFIKSSSLSELESSLSLKKKKEVFRSFWSPLQTSLSSSHQVFLNWNQVFRRRNKSLQSKIFTPSLSFVISWFVKDQLTYDSTLESSLSLKKLKVFLSWSLRSKSFIPSLSIKSVNEFNWLRLYGVCKSFFEEVFLICRKSKSFVNHT